MSLFSRLYHGVLKAHEELYRRSDGRVGHKLLGVPTLLLRTTGRRSGMTRTNGLVYAPDEGRYLVVPSNGGASKAPGWLHNLRAKPTAEIQIERKREPVVAEIVGRGDADFDRLWRIVNENNRGRYDGYQTSTTREIPVVVLTPAPRQ